MPTLQWIGKEKVINHHHDVPFKVLNHQYTFNSNDGVLAGDSPNKIIHGDNLEALKALLPEYEGKIKCIYIDPPYNTGNESWVYNDNVNHPKLKKWLGQVVGKDSEDLTRHDKWLCMMYPRLVLLHKLLAKDGAIFISIDDNEVENLKTLLNDIFGKSNLLANQVWENKEGGGSSDSKHFRIKHEYIVSYAKDISKAFINGVDITNEERYNLRDSYSFTRGPYYLQKLGMGSIQYSDSLDYPITTPDSTTITATEGNSNKKACWRWSQPKFDWGIVNDFIVFKKDKNNMWQVYTKQYLFCDNYGILIERTNRPMGVINNFSSTQASKNLEKIFNNRIFNYSKPVELIEYILKIASDTNSIILDSFAGSGTTAHAVLNLNKKDGGNRKFILIEMEDYAETITAERVKRVINGYADKTGTGGSFDYYQLGEPLFIGENNEYLNEAVSTNQVKSYVWYSETREHYTPQNNSSDEYLLGIHYNTAYYFIYHPTHLTTLDYETLMGVSVQAGHYIIYADNCLLSKDFLFKNNIVFKKIPRDITRF